jgi:hypothetical protein
LDYNKHNVGLQPAKPEGMAPWKTAKSENVGFLKKISEVRAWEKRK